MKFKNLLIALVLIAALGILFAIFYALSEWAGSTPPKQERPTVFPGI
jgi:hypothetical protein